MTMGAFVGCSLLTMDRSIESLGCHSWRFGAEWMKHSRRDDYINVKLAALSRSSGTRRACEGAHPPRAVATMFRRLETRLSTRTRSGHQTDIWYVDFSAWR